VKENCAYRNKHLECVIKSHNIENNEALIEAYRKKRNEIKEAIENKYTDTIYSPLNSGSLKKHTAINIKFDMDIVVPFKRGIKLEDMFKELFEYFDKEYRRKDTTLLGVHKQKVSIGLELMVDGHLLNIDIVPGREIDDYEKDGDLNLYVNEDMGSLKKTSYLKTNIQKQIDYVKENTGARETIKLIKVWKRRTNQNIKSFLIELISIEASKSKPSSVKEVWDTLKYTLEFIRDDIAIIKLVDPGNSGNVITDSLYDFEKTNISDAIKWMLDGIERNEDSIKEYFPVNHDYPCEEGNKAIYVKREEQRATELGAANFG
jgi:hypothetical protein